MKFNNRQNTPIKTEDGIIFHSRSVAICNTVIAMHNNKAYVLIGKRSKNMDNAHKLNLPCGYLDWDETLTGAVKRELYEETKLNVDDILSNKNYNVLYWDEKPWDITSNINTEKQNVTLHYSLIFVCSELPKIEHDFESVWVKWIPVNDFLSINEDVIAFNHQNVLSRFLDKTF